MFQMNCTSVLGFFPHKSAIPLELAMPLYLTRDDFRYKRIPKLGKPLRSCVHRTSILKVKPQDFSNHSEEKSKAKKQVSFADHKGFALTMVKIFSEFDDHIDIPLNIQELIDTVVNMSMEEDHLILDFAQPSSDYLAFRQRLEVDCVCLENCMLKEKSLVGTVKVKNLSFEKSVKMRVTFDTWKSFRDVECQYVKDTYTGSDKDTFSFEINLPSKIPPHERIEFAVLYECCGQTFWDSNQGQNYKVVRSVLKSSSQNGDKGGFQSSSAIEDLGIHCDLYGSPRCAHGIFPEWPSYAGYEKIGPYY
ncbi:protein phosphatase 1 regulatory subunit 3B isoform X1 [Lepisosteus oculatus]|uniref:protein phosphatase 1 regulatory subunit 3B isoform X1 n=1 Tax=Lepisosteus oculatus TaxID=7918 RepID=UPI00073FBD64|nr:PREDICTED: protein phosphatase 1 regulatory subunit 3B isoform X1 [Lepisosteus oculatus]